MNEKLLTPIEIGLTAAVVAIEANEPRILVASGGEANEPRAGLPFGPFDPLAHRTLELGLREWVEEQTGLRLGYVEQLYSFGDRGRHALLGDTGPHVVSVGYLALTRINDVTQQPRVPGAAFEPWYRYFPWEDWRKERPPILESDILPALNAWAKEAEARRFFGREPKLPADTAQEFLTPWPAQRAERRFLARFRSLK